jgi:hypothetical protein
MVTASAFSAGNVYPSDATGGSVTTVGPPSVRNTKQDWPTHVIERLGDWANRIAENAIEKSAAQTSMVE